MARNLRIHMTSEKHTHNMMVLQQNVKQLQEGLQLNPFAAAAAGGDPSTMMNPMLAAAAAAAMGAGGVPMDPSNPAFAEFAAYNQALFMQQLQQQQIQALQQHHMQQQLQQQRDQHQQQLSHSPGNSSSPGATTQRSSPGSPGASGCGGGGGGGVDGPMDLSAEFPTPESASASSVASLLTPTGCLVASEAACSSESRLDDVVKLMRSSFDKLLLLAYSDEKGCESIECTT